MIIVSITGPTVREALAQIRTSWRYTDMYELRLDLIQDADSSRLLRSISKPTIAACRPLWEGGMFERSESERRLVLVEAALAGATFVDIELKALDDSWKLFLHRRAKCKVIVSLHTDGARTVNVRRLYAQMRATGGDVLKLAYPAHDAWEMRGALEFLARAAADRQKAVAIATGDHGEATRILYRKFGGWATYAAPEVGDAAAAGQLRASVLRELYCAQRLTRRTKLYGVIGNPVGQSKGVLLHNPLLRRAGRNAVYVALPVSRLEKFMAQIAPLMSGFSVTIPHKREILKYLDDIHPAAKAIGAVNTVVNRGGRLVGMNTDAPGALDAIEAVIKVGGKRILVLGAGGAARAIAYEAKRRGAEVLIANRTARKALLLAREFGGASVDLATIKSSDFDIVANATPVGMVPNPHVSLLPKTLLRNKVVFDAVYNPSMTKLLQDARSVGATIVPGVEMYVRQAALQYRLYYGLKPDVSMMRHILTGR